MPPLLGCIADDFTGGTDLAGMLRKHGMRTVQMIGVPQGSLPEDIDAVVIALKSRTVPPQDAVAQSLAALAFLRDAGCRQFYFKYCSTFDSTDKGNIGPVTDALMTALNTSFTIACPAFPENRRMIFKGHLFVGDVLLNESGMQNHPLTPMSDPNLVRVLQRQTKRSVGLVDYDVVAAGADAIRARFRSLQDEGVEVAIVDAISNEHLLQIGEACAELPLLTGGSGVALGLPQNFRRQGLLAESHEESGLLQATGLRAVLSGSCSVMTQRQVRSMMDAGYPAFAIDPLRLATDKTLVDDVLKWAAPLLKDGPVLVYATAAPEKVKSVQSQLGVERAGQIVEEAFAAIAKGMGALGVRQFVVAGGETSGAVVHALGVRGLRIGSEIDPGVPWTASIDDPSTLFALKSGNFGGDDFFVKAWELLG